MLRAISIIRPVERKIQGFAIGLGNREHHLLAVADTARARRNIPRVSDLDLHSKIFITRSGIAFGI